jgi:hypothetical protein
MSGWNGPFGLQLCLDVMYNSFEGRIHIGRNLVCVRLKRSSATCIKDEIGIDGP